MSHTPGPWTLDQSDLGIVIDAEGDPIQTAGSGNVVSEEGYANACLIAAAPDLLAACELALEKDGDLRGATRRGRIRDAIAKAKGTS